MKKYVLALDAGTTSSRAILFKRDGSIAAMAGREFPQIFPKEGWVEHDPLAIWSTQVSVATEALLKIGASWDEVHGIGITNQRETVIIWDRKTGMPVYNAIVWQCRRTADFCEELKRLGYEDTVRKKTGLLLDPYFSASKIKWILDNVEGARDRAELGELAMGTVDTWLIWKLTGGTVHATDFSNASRTMLFNINTLEWDEELLQTFNIPRAILPEVLPSSHVFGYTKPEILGAALPIAGVAGDQQAALFGQCCFGEGDVKNTYGTGAFLLMNTANKPYVNKSGLIATVAWCIDGNVTYALEGSVFTAGAAIQWLRDGLGIISTAAESEGAARTVPDSGGVVVVPALSGLGAPYWDPYSRGLIIGITRATTKNHIIRATLESIAYETADVVELMEEVTGKRTGKLRVDGGASANGLLLEVQADILGVKIERPKCIETTARGAAFLAGLALGVYKSTDEILENNSIEKTVLPSRDTAWRDAARAVWKKAVRRSLLWKE